jgi:hypothetical protein
MIYARICLFDMQFCVVLYENLFDISDDNLFGIIYDTLFGILYDNFI